MSNTALPQLIEPSKWADQSLVLAQRLPLQGFERLLQGALAQDGEVVVDLRFSRDARGLVRAQGQVSTNVALTCQRCLQPKPQALEADVDVYLLGNEMDAERLDDSEEYVLLEQGQLEIRGLLEDELILVLPIVVRHDDCESAVPLQSEAGPAPVKENPFQILASLKAPEAK